VDVARRGENDNPTMATIPSTPRRSRSSSIPERTSYRDIPEFFFQIHDPTTKNRQSADIGSDCRSEIFSTSDEQARLRESSRA
jgi:hypothetical protein